ncbi:MAG: hypothetical protein EXS32_13205 [Opitutus sp.]|nr:hypothetical protein [Opitutus sp.]
MSDSTSHSPRPVSLIVTLSVLVLSALFYVVVQRFYRPVSAAPQNSAAENLPKDHSLDWKATPASRQAALAELLEKQAKQAAAYAWVDQQAGVVQLPIERAMDLTAQHYGAKK